MNHNVTLPSCRLYRLPRPLKSLVLAFLLLQTLAVGVGLAYVYHNTQISQAGIARHYGGEQPAEEDFDIPENYAKPLGEMLITTHNHLFGFAFIFLVTAILFYFTGELPAWLKNTLLIEPFITVLLTFGGLWLVRFVSTEFSVAVILFSALTYLSYFFMAGVILAELFRAPGNG